MLQGSHDHYLIQSPIVLLGDKRHLFLSHRFDLSGNYLTGTELLSAVWSSLVDIALIFYVSLLSLGSVVAN